ncbi:MAG: phosphotyrosine protein phosphatase [Candidatus Contendobacter odensis]|uniref:protein-tyrosine-phosphatase n=1 Tax=Candidatus Contendibacter odensensis TaxID=1400860 RepID=A0A2G6PGE2_9GAMM|nr:MAG: phosphotyrosine protein phosphatase [Candidatus Contendobacter odensis]
MLKVLFVCMGNICRSPVAEGVFQRMLEEADLSRKIAVDSAGTHSYHIGSQPDTRSQSTARLRDIDLSNLRARQIDKADFSEFDYILAMDRSNLEHLLFLCQDSSLQRRIRLLMDFAPDLPEREVPDPYYGGANGFDRVMDMIEVAAQGLLKHIREQHGI